MPKPLPPLETDTVSVPTLPQEHGELSRDELIELFGEEKMAYIFELCSRQAALTVSRPSPDRRETTAITTSARKSKSKSTDIAGARQPSRPKKQTIGVGKRVFVERKHLKYMFDPTSESFAIIEMNSSDKFRFFGSVVGKPNKLYCVKLDLLPSSANEVCISRSSIEVLAPGQEEEPYIPRAQAESEMIQECSEVVEGGSGKSKFVEQSYSHFTNLPVENQAIASEFVLKYGQEEESVIQLFPGEFCLKKSRSQNVPWREREVAWLKFKQFMKGSHGTLTLVKLTTTECCLTISSHRSPEKPRYLMTFFIDSQRIQVSATDGR